MLARPIIDGIQIVTIIYGFYSYYYLMVGFNVKAFTIATGFSIMIGLASYQEYKRLKAIESTKWNPYPSTPKTDGPKEVLKDGKILIRHFDASTGYFEGVYKYDAWRENQSR